MPELVSMKHTEEELKKDCEGMPSEFSPEEYPYGLRLYLTDDSVEKLNAERFSAGEDLVMVARVRVKGKGVREEETEDGSEKKSHLELQITDMGLDKEANASEKVSKLYPSMNEKED